MDYINGVWARLYWRERAIAGENLLTHGMMSGMTMMTYAKRAYLNLGQNRTGW